MLRILNQRFAAVMLLSILSLSLVSCGAFMQAQKGEAPPPPPSAAAPRPSLAVAAQFAPPPQWNTEEYSKITETSFLETVGNPLSTFSIDVDTASYTNVRRFLRQNRMPPKDAVRIEEMVNYFSYSYREPEGAPLGVTAEYSSCPWNDKHTLAKIGLQGKRIPLAGLPPSNLVFLIDVSGSMADPNKLPLLKQAFKMLVNELRPVDRVAIVVYASRSGLLMPSTPGSEKTTIKNVIESLEAGGSTAGGEAIQLAYRVAKENFLKEGNNRVILATDGDFNVGISDTGSLVRFVEEQRKDGIYLSVLGFGMGNLKDSRMEQLADKGNGNYAYIDSLLEAKKVLVTQMTGTLFTIANDVKIQVEFNPSFVKAYRLIGYESRMLRPEEFKDDKKDAGELGSGHTVTALYEIIPAGSAEAVPGTDALKYQKTVTRPDAAHANELMTVKVRYKDPGANESKELIFPVKNGVTPFERMPADFRFASAVAEFGLLLRDSEYKGRASYADVAKRALDAKGEDREGYRAEFIALVETAEILDKKVK